MSDSVKICNKCGGVFDLSCFYVHPAGLHGRGPACKECTKAGVRANRAAKIEQYRAYDASRSMRQDRVAAREAYIRTDAGKAAKKRASDAYIDRNPIKAQAHNAVSNAVRDGKLTKLPCEVCGKTRAQAHHDDYGKPLEVRWLCTTHHAEWHRHNDPIVPAQ